MFFEDTLNCKRHTSTKLAKVHVPIAGMPTRSSNYGFAATPHLEDMVAKVLMSEILPNSKHIPLKFSEVLGLR